MAAASVEQGMPRVLSVSSKAESIPYREAALSRRRWADPISAQAVGQSRSPSDSTYGDSPQH